MAIVNNKLPPEKKALLLQFTYMLDCIVKIPIAFHKKNNQYLIKLPIKAPESWNLPNIIQKVNLTPSIELKIYEDLINNVDHFWTSACIQTIATNNENQIYEIKEPQYIQGHTKRKHERVFVFAPVTCKINNSSPIQAICTDISLDGLGLKIKQQLQLPEKAKFQIQFHKPFDKFPPLVGVLAHQNTNFLDNTSIFGVKLDTPSTKTISTISQELIKHNQIDNGSLGNRLIAQKKAKNKSEYNKLFNLFEF